jgi:hypothetical protein
MAAFVQSAHNPRMLAVLRYIVEHDAGEGVTVSVRELAKELEMPLGSVVTHLKWLKTFGVVRAIVQAKPGEGRRPNRYVPTMTLEEWQREGPGIATDLRARLEGKPGRRLPERPRPGDLMVEAAEAALEELPAPDLGELEGAPLDDDAVDAWLALG